MNADDIATVDLSNQRLAEIPEDVLTRCNNIAVLDLSRNRGIRLDSVLERFRILRKLALTYCALFSLPVDISDITQLEDLDLSGNDFSGGLNPPVGRLSKLRKLVLSRCELQSVPDWLGDLEALEELQLGYNNFSDGLNRAVGRLRTLRKLVLSWCALRTVPDWLGDLESLEELDLSWNDFSGGLNPVVGRLHALRKLFLSRCELRSVPDWIGDLEALEELRLGYNYFFGGLNPAFGRLHKLRKLALSRCALQSVPDWLGDLQSLQELQLEWNNFSSGLNSAVGGLRTLKKLVLSRCELRSLPDSIGDLEALEELKLDLNDFFDGLNPVVGRLIRLKKLDLSSCRLRWVPDWLGNLEALEELLLEGNDFSYGLDPAVGRLHTLRKLVLIRCELRSLPDWLGCLEALEELELSGNDFSGGLSPAVGRLQTLRKLVLSQCRLPSVPDCLGDLEALEELALAENDFSGGLSRIVGRLSRLRRLVLYSCELRSVPDWLGDLEALSFLDLGNNCLKEYPPCLLRMKSLKELDISNDKSGFVVHHKGTEVIGNCINNLPVALAFTRLLELGLQGNPITEPPKTIWEQGLDAIKAYLRALIPGGQLMPADTINVIGDTGAGKSSIAESLVARSPHPTAACDRTRVLRQLRMRIDETSGQCVNINDFGGHEIYHSVMPIFLPTNGLVILAFDLTDENQELRVKNWLLTSLAKCQEIRVILAGTHSDELSDAKRLTLEDRMRAFSSNILESAVNEMNAHICCIESRSDKKTMQDKLKKLRELLSNLCRSVLRVVTLSCSVPNAGLVRLCELVVELVRPAENLPASWCRIINEMLLINAEDIFITKLQVESIYKKYFGEVDDESVRTILRYLAKTSQILWVEDHPRLRNFIFHSPQVIIDACKEILLHDIESLHLSAFTVQDLEDYNCGILRQSLLSTLLNAYDGKLKTSQERVAHSPRPILPVVVDFMQEFNLISHLNTEMEGKKFIIPCKLSSVPPTQLKEFKQAEENSLNKVTVHLSFNGSVVPLSFFETSLASMLTVAGSFGKAYVGPWRRGLIFVSGQVHFQAKHDESGITLTAFTKSSDASPWTVLQPMLRSLNDNAVASWHGAPPRCAIQCPWCSRNIYSGDDRQRVGEIVIDLATLASRDQQKNQQPNCPTCLKAIPVSLCFPTTLCGSFTEDQKEICEFFQRNGRAWEPGATQTASMDSDRPRNWENIDEKQLSATFRTYYKTLIDTLTKNEVREIASQLYSQGYILVTERESIYVKTNTPTEAATDLIDIVTKKNTKELYGAVLEILYSRLHRKDLVTALTSLRL